MKMKKEKEIEESIQIIVYLKIWHDDPRWSCDVLVARKCGPDIFIISIFSLCWWMFYVQCQELGGLFSTFFPRVVEKWWRLSGAALVSPYAMRSPMPGVALLTPTNFHAVDKERKRDCKQHKLCLITETNL